MKQPFSRTAFLQESANKLVALLRTDYPEPLPDDRHSALLALLEDIWETAQAKQRCVEAAVSEEGRMSAFEKGYFELTQAIEQGRFYSEAIYPPRGKEE